MNFFNKFFEGRQNQSLLYKIVLTFFVLSEITAIYIVYAANLNYVDSLKNSTFEQVIAVKSAKKLQLQNWLLESQYESFIMSSSPEIRQKIANVIKTKSDNIEYVKNITELRNKLGSIIDKSSKIDSIFVVDNSDKVLVSIDGLSSGESFKQDPEESYKSIVRLENTNSSKKLTPKDSSNLSFVLAIKNGKPVIVFVNPIFDENGNPLTNILVNMKFDQIISLIFDQSNSIANSETYLITKFQNKNLIISKDFQGIKEDNEIINNAGLDSVIRDSELRGDKNRAEYKNYLGAFVFGSYSWIDNLNIALVSEINQKTALEPVDRTLRNISLIATGLVVFMTAVCYALVRHRIKSIFKIADVALSIAEGNLETRFPATHKDEIGALAIAFNNMLSRFKYLNQQFIESQYVFSQKVNQSDEILQNFMDSTNEGVAFLDRNNLVSQINFNLAEILSISIPDANGARYDSVFPEEICRLIDATRWKHQEIAITEFSIPYQNTYKARVSNIFCEATGSGKMQFLGMIVVVWESIQPILSSSLLAEEYQEAIHNTHNDLAIRNEISNRLRTPLTSLLGFLKLTRGKLEGVIFPKLNSIDAESQRAVRQISNNFEIMISESTQIAISIETILDQKTSGNNLVNDSQQNLERILFVDILNQVNLETAQLFKEKDSRLIFDIVDVSLASLECNRAEIIYIFTNLLTRIANFLNVSRVAICHARLVNGQIAVIIGEVNALLSHKQILFIVNDVYNLIDNIDYSNPPSKEMGLTTIQEVLQKYNGTISLEQIDSLRNRCKFYVVTLPNTTIV